MSRRLLKMYIRDKDKVFRAVEGLKYSKRIIIIDKSVYTIASHLTDDDFLVIIREVDD